MAGNGEYTVKIGIGVLITILITIGGWFINTQQNINEKLHISIDSKVPKRRYHIDQNKLDNRLELLSKDLRENQKETIKQFMKIMERLPQRITSNDKR